MPSCMHTKHESPLGSTVRESRKGGRPCTGIECQEIQHLTSLHDTDRIALMISNRDEVQIYGRVIENPYRSSASALTREHFPSWCHVWGLWKWLCNRENSRPEVGQPLLFITTVFPGVWGNGNSWVRGEYALRLQTVSKHDISAITDWYEPQRERWRHTWTCLVQVPKQTFVVRCAGWTEQRGNVHWSTENVKTVFKGRNWTLIQLDTPALMFLRAFPSLLSILPQVACFYPVYDV